MRICQKQAKGVKRDVISERANDIPVAEPLLVLNFIHRYVTLKL
jgi:hypothetical protein